MWRSCTDCTPGKLTIFCSTSDTQMCGGMPCSSNSPNLYVWRGELPVKQWQIMFNRFGYSQIWVSGYVLEGIYRKHEEPDLWFSYGQQYNHTQRCKARIHVHQEAAGLRTVEAVWVNQQHHQAVDQTQNGGRQILNDKGEWKEPAWPPATWCRAFSLMCWLADCFFTIWKRRGEFFWHDMLSQEEDKLDMKYQYWGKHNVPKRE